MTFWRSPFDCICKYLSFEYNIDFWPFVTLDDLGWPFEGHRSIAFANTFRLSIISIFDFWWPLVTFFEEKKFGGKNNFSKILGPTLDFFSTFKLFLAKIFFFDKSIFYPHVCVLPACVHQWQSLYFTRMSMYHTLAPCAALLPIFFSTPYRSHARNFITNSNFCTPFSLLDSYLNPPSDRPPIARYIFNRWPFARRSKWQISLFWPFCAYPTRVRARKKHSSTGFSLLCDIPFDAELDALLTLKICWVLDLYEKFHREKIGRNDVENRRFS